MIQFPAPRERSPANLADELTRLQRVSAPACPTHPEPQGTRRVGAERTAEMGAPTLLRRGWRCRSTVRQVTMEGSDRRRPLGSGRSAAAANGNGTSPSGPSSSPAASAAASAAAAAASAKLSTFVKGALFKRLISWSVIILLYLHILVFLFKYSLSARFSLLENILIADLLSVLLAFKAYYQFYCDQLYSNFGWIHYLCNNMRIVGLTMLVSIGLGCLCCFHFHELTTNILYPSAIILVSYLLHDYFYWESIKADAFSAVPKHLFISIKNLFLVSVKRACWVAFVVFVLKSLVVFSLSGLGMKNLFFLLPNYETLLIAFFFVACNHFVVSNAFLIFFYPLKFSTANSETELSNAMELLDTIRAIRNDNSMAPKFVQNLRFQRELSDDALNCVYTSSCSAPLIPVFSHYINNSISKLVIRFLALQDFNRVFRANYLRRKVIFESNWNEMAISACFTIDVATLQIQLLTAHMIRELLTTDALDVDDDDDSKSLHAQELRNISWATSQIVSRNKLRRERKSPFGMVIKYILKLKFLKGTYVNYLLHYLIGCFVVSSPISLMESYNIIHSIESLVLSLECAQNEEISHQSKLVCVQNYLPVILQSLLGLELAIDAYSDALRRVYSSGNKVYQRLYVAQKKNHNSFLSQDIQAIASVNAEFLNRLLRAYRDIIPTYPYPVTYSELLQRKLQEL